MRGALKASEDTQFFECLSLELYLALAGRCGSDSCLICYGNLAALALNSFQPTGAA